MKYSENKTHDVSHYKEYHYDESLRYDINK